MIYICGSENNISNLYEGHINSIININKKNILKLFIIW